MSKDKCSICWVPFDLHGTCCGWTNASVPINNVGIISDARHPFNGKTLSEWGAQKNNALFELGGKVWTNDDLKNIWP